MMNCRRVGLLVPSSNTTVETEFRKILPAHMTLHCSRLFIDQVNLESIRRMTEDIEHHARLLASADVDIIVLGATAPSLILGSNHDKAVCRQLEAATGKRSTTTATAVLAALKAVKARKIVIASPFSPPVNQICVNFFEGNGFDVVASHGMNVTDNLQIGRLDPTSAYDMAVEADQDDADALVLACTNWATLPAIERIEKKLGKPVIATGQASAWHTLRLLNFDTPMTGFGRLLEAH